MDAQEYAVMYQAEQGHWWYLGMTAITRYLIHQWVRPTTPIRILDAGCGTGGAMSSILSSYGTVTGFDISSLALMYCKKRSLQRILQASVAAIPFPMHSFDLVTSFDVLYEQTVENDDRAMLEFSRVVIPGGYLFLRLPAYNWLRGRHDQVVHTRQRYTLAQVKRMLETSGFRVRMVSYANTFLFLPAMVKRLCEHLIPNGDIHHSDLEFQVGKLNGLLQLILSSEAHIISSIGMPFGLSVIAVGQKNL
jgi:SAM-dependent methyltransferase